MPKKTSSANSTIDLPKYGEGGFRSSLSKIKVFGGNDEDICEKSFSSAKNLRQISVQLGHSSRSRALNSRSLLETTTKTGRIAKSGVSKRISKPFKLKIPILIKLSLTDDTCVL